MRDTILFGKYQLCRTIGKGQVGTVYLARHLGLGEYRAIKRVAKVDSCYNAFRREALLLKSLHHPGIPMVYDLEEDETYCYLIEEFLEGESISALVKRQGNLTGNMVIRYGIQICDLVHYLHSAGTEPILYLDLQPNNLMLCHETIKMVDFGCADYLSQANRSTLRYGTLGCAAPEQYTREPLDEKTDVYAIGVLLFYLATGHLPEKSNCAGLVDRDLALGRGLHAVIRDCLSGRKGRVASALEVKRRLERLIKLEPWRFQNDSLPSLILSFAGSESNTGSTHLALGLSACLWKWGIPNLYEEHNNSGHSTIMAERAHSLPDSAGICHVGRWAIRPDYGPQVRFEIVPGYPVIIRDYGSIKGNAALSKNAAGRQRFVCVCGGKAYDTRETQKAVYAFREIAQVTGLVYNFPERNFRPERFGGEPFLCCLAAPYFEDAGKPGREAEKFFKQLWDKLTETKGVEQQTAFYQRAKIFFMKKKP